MRIVLIGFSQGYYAVEYTRYLSRLKGIDIPVVCDLGENSEYVRSCAFVDAAAFADDVGARLVHTMDEALSCQPDAVLICCETMQHTKLAQQALKVGAYVFVSKPLCFSSDQADALAMYPGSNRILCGQPLRHEEGIRELIDRIHEIGKPYSVRIRLCHAAMVDQVWERDSSKSGGPLGTYGVYLFDLARILGGEMIDTLYALGLNTSTPQIQDVDTVKILAKGNRVQFVLELFSAVQTPMPFFQAEVTGDCGMLVTHYDNAVTVAHFPDSQRAGALRTSNMAHGEMDHFLDCINGKSSPACSVKNMQYITRCIEATRTSMAAFKPVTIDKEGIKE